MNQLDALRKTATIINTEFKHCYYDENCELYEKYLTLSTGKGWENFLHRLTSRVSKEDFQQIIDITIDICKSVTKNLTHVFYRVTRSIGIKIEYDLTEKSKEEDFTDILTTFGRYGFEGYMDRRFTDFCKIDPNGFLVIEFKETDGKDYARPYPVEYYSPDIIDYGYDLNKLIYLVVKQDISKSAGKIDEVVQDYTCYVQEGAIKFISRPDIENAPVFDFNKTDYKTGDLIALKERTEKNEKGDDETVYDVYELYIPVPYDLKWVPAISVGYLPDEYHKGDTFLNFFDNAVPLLEKIIKANSESDISMAKHCFAQKLQFVRPCPKGCEINEQGLYCYEGSVCPTCHGTGEQDFHRSGMDVISFPLTDENLASVDLDNIVKYVSSLPLETIKYQWEHIIDHLVAFAKRVMYNTEIFSKSEVQDTATAKLIEMENMYDTIYIYACHFAAVKTWVLETISAITTIEIDVNSTVSKDFKLLGKSELIAMLQAATTAGANPAVIEAINDEIAYSFFGNSPAYQNYLNRKKLLPFQNKSREQVMLILSELPVDNYYRMMFEYGEEIIKLLEISNPNWSQFTIEKQKSLIDVELEKIKKELQPESNPNPPQV